MGRTSRRRHGPRARHAVAAAIAVAVVQPPGSPASAQDDGDGGGGQDGGDALEMGEIRVEGETPSPFDPVDGYKAERSATATRMDIPIDETPAPVQVVPKEILADSGADRVEDALDFTAGAQKGNPFGGKNEGILLRGFEASFAEDGAFASGGPLASSGVRDSAVVERIEVVRGPSSALLGPGTPGGVINVVTKRPQGDTFFETESSASTFQRLRQTFDANTAFGQDKRLQARISGAVEYSDSFRDGVDGNRQVVAPAVTFEPGDDLRIRYRGEYQRDAGEFDRGVPIDSDGDFVTDDDTYLGDPDDGDTITENLGSQLEAEYDVTDAWTARVFGGWDRSRLDGEATEPRARGPIPNVFTQPPPQLVLTANQVARLRRERDQETTVWTGRAEITGDVKTGPIAHKALLSFEARDLSRDSEIREGNFLQNIQTQTNIVNLNALQTDLPEQPLTQLSDTENDITNYGITLFDQIKPIDEISLLVGGRFDVIDQTQNANGNVTDVNETEFSPTVGAVVRPVPWGSLFFRYSQSFEPNTATSQTNEPLPPQEGESFEGGVRAKLLDDAVRATVTAFHITLDNEPQDSLMGNFSVPATRTSEGVEVSVQGAVTDRLSVIANYTYTDAELSDVPGPRDGESPAGVPTHAANAFASYDVGAGGLDGLSLNGGVVFNGERLNTNSQLFNGLTVGGNDLDSYVRLDAGAQYEIQSWLTAGVKVANITDTEYSRPSTPGFTIPEPGRTFSGRVRLRF